jgi:hypothetical protein
MAMEQADDLALLRKERDQFMKDSQVLTQLYIDGNKEPKVDLKPAIKSQQRANASIERAIKRYVTFREPVANVRHVMSSNRLQSTYLPENIGFHTSDKVKPDSTQ